MAGPPPPVRAMRAAPAIAGGALSFVLGARELKGALQACVQHAGVKDTARPWMQGVRFVPHGADDALFLYGTDGHRVAVYEVAGRCLGTWKGTALLPIARVDELMRACDLWPDEEAEVSILSGKLRATLGADSLVLELEARPHAVEMLASTNLLKVLPKHRAGLSNGLLWMNARYLTDAVAAFGWCDLRDLKAQKETPRDLLIATTEDPSGPILLASPLVPSLRIVLAPIALEGGPVHPGLPPLQ